ncbi:helix-turn-helix domain-containing protein [Actinoplanes sp. LDG1-06]|uniref:Helix-turn-helix domain-containing protein n=1 Tax=Paractinoplanes ovalisporus TaxID=2810368 RepID=A0ABS2AMY1_9ACTN|nr:helix-turn-helix domain-containing protein [Actinoplanes ovalisporus]MBM2621206.1 helix-turn-helix domain-containing protein [Actinoplanes ovalisporus]
MQNEMLRLNKVATILDVSVSTVRRLIKDGTLAAGFVRGQLRVSSRDLDAYISSVLTERSAVAA